MDYLDLLYEKEGSYENIVTLYDEIIDSLKELKKEYEDEMNSKMFYEEELEGIRTEIKELEKKEREAEWEEREKEYERSVI